MNNNNNGRRPVVRDEDYGWLWLFLALTFLLALAALILACIAFSRANDSDAQNTCVALCHGPCMDGINGTNGVNGVDGSSGVLDFADFFALMPGDNTATIALGGFVQFPQIGAAHVATGIIQQTASTFQLTAVGTYEVNFFVTVAEAGQLQLNLDGTAQTQTVTGRATGENYILGSVFITTTMVNQILAVQNPAGNSAALTITPIAGGASAVSAHLSIVRLI